MLYLCNAFSIAMLSSFPVRIEIWKIPIEEARRALADEKFESAIGHADVARILEGMLDMSIPINRVSVRLTEADTVIVAQYVGPRLPEGATKLPEGARIEFFQVSIVG